MTNTIETTMLKFIKYMKDIVRLFKSLTQSLQSYNNHSKINNILAKSLNLIKTYYNHNMSIGIIVNH